MATIVYEPSTYNFPNLTIEKGMVDGIVRLYRLTANEGYVFYDTTANDTETDPETMEERPVIYYRTVASLPANYNFANFPYIAVPRDSVDENYIFGAGDNNHEVM